MRHWLSAIDDSRRRCSTCPEECKCRRRPRCCGQQGTDDNPGQAADGQESRRRHHSPRDNRPATTDRLTTNDRLLRPGSEVEAKSPSPVIRRLQNSFSYLYRVTTQQQNTQLGILSNVKRTVASVPMAI